MLVPLEEGSGVVVEVDRHEISTDLVLASSRAHEVAVKASETLEEVLDKVKPTIQAIAQWARTGAPDECCVEFGLKLGGETGIIVAKGTAEVNFVVKMTWKNTT
jgi:hypothetical protein